MKWTRRGWGVEGRKAALSRTVLALLAVLSGLVSCATEAQAFEINWFTIDGGGGTSSGGSFSISGTVGQADAGEIAGGEYRIRGGFWGISVLVQTPSAPRLSVSRDANSGSVTISWTLPADGWVLQESPSLGQAPTPWVLVPPETYQSNATHRFITIANPSGIKFFRLQRP